MSPKPSEDDLQVVEQYVREFCTPLVPLSTLYSELEADEMNLHRVSHCLVWLEYEDRVWMLHVQDEKATGLPSGGYAYIPYDGMDEPLKL